MALRNSQINKFFANGYIKLSNILDKKILRRITQQSLELFNKNDTPGPIVRNRDKYIVKILGLHNRGSFYNDLIINKNLLDVLENILGPNIEFTKYRHNHVVLYAPKGGVAGFHRDVLNWSRSMVTVILSLDKATAGNGCLYIIPKSHNMYLKPKTSKESWRLLDFKNPESLKSRGSAIKTKTGDIIIFNSNLFHMAGNPIQDRIRRMTVTLGYRSTDELERRGDAGTILVRGNKIYLGNDIHNKK